MKILAGAQRKRKIAASYMVSTPDAEAGSESAVSAAAGTPPTVHPLFLRAVWGLLLLSLLESMVLAGMVYRMPMETPADQPDILFDTGSAEAILAGQARLLGLADSSQAAQRPLSSYPAVPIRYPAVIRLEDADIPGLPANLAKQQLEQQGLPDMLQAAPPGSSPNTSDGMETPRPGEKAQDLPVPDQIPRAPMPVLDFHSIFDQAVTPAAPDRHAPPGAPAVPSAAAPAVRADAPPAVTPDQADGAPIEMYLPGAPVAALPPPGKMVIKPHPAQAASAARPSSGGGAPQPAAASGPVAADAAPDIALPILPRPPVLLGGPPADMPGNPDEEDQRPLPPVVRPTPYLPGADAPVEVQAPPGDAPDEPPPAVPGPAQ